MAKNPDFGFFFFFFFGGFWAIFPYSDAKNPKKGEAGYGYVIARRLARPRKSAAASPGLF